MLLPPVGSGLDGQEGGGHGFCVRLDAAPEGHDPSVSWTG